MIAELRYVVAPRQSGVGQVGAGAAPDCGGNSSVQPLDASHAFIAFAIAPWLLNPGAGLPPKSRIDSAAGLALT